MRGREGKGGRGERKRKEIEKSLRSAVRRSQLPGPEAALAGRPSETQPAEPARPHRETESDDPRRHLPKGSEPALLLLMAAPAPSIQLPDSNPCPLPARTGSPWKATSGKVKGVLRNTRNPNRSLADGVDRRWGLQGRKAERELGD